MRERTPRFTPSLDQDALDALDFAARGRPGAEIGYSGDAPRPTPEQLAEFEPAHFRIVRRRRRCPPQNGESGK